jgi:hypothetical protein
VEAVLEKGAGLADRAVGDALAGLDAGGHDIHQDGKGGNHAVQDGPRPADELNHGLKGVLELAEHGLDNHQKARRGAIHGRPHRVHRVENDLDGVGENRKVVVDGVQDESRIRIHRLHRTVYKVRSDVRTHHAGQRHVHWIAAVLDPVRLDLFHVGHSVGVGSDRKGYEGRQRDHQNGYGFDHLLSFGIRNRFIKCLRPQLLTPT